MLTAFTRNGVNEYATLVTSKCQEQNLTTELNDALPIGCTSNNNNNNKQTNKKFTEKHQGGDGEGWLAKRR